jgi:uncharacterized protein YjeT (DUF2065 family)
MWQELWIALALMMVIEGIVPFVSPGSLRRALLMLAQMDDRSVRVLGLVSMLSGVVLLYIVR